MPTKNGERELRGRSSGDGPVMIAFSNRSQGLTTPSSAGRPMLPALPHRSKATLGAPGRVRHIRTQTESSGCAPDSLKSSGLSRSAWAPRPPSLFETKSQLVSPCSPQNLMLSFWGPRWVWQLSTIHYQLNNMRAMTKSELAQAAGVSRRTLIRWLNSPTMKEKLKPFTVNKKQILLPPGAVEIICKHYVIEID